MNMAMKWLLELPKHRFKALKKSRLKKLMRLEAEDQKGFLKSRSKLEYAYDQFTQIKNAERAINSK
jgi:hypothetical protein